MTYCNFKESTSIDFWKVIYENIEKKKKIILQQTYLYIWSQAF